MQKTIRKPSKKLTPYEAAIIKALLQQGHFQNRIAAYFDINPGRVSEIKTGQRFSHILPARPEEVPTLH
jgi:hypothetical protein